MKIFYIFGANGQDGKLTKYSLQEKYKECTLVLFSRNFVRIESSKNKLIEQKITSQNEYLNIISEILVLYKPDLIFYYAAVHYSSFEKQNKTKDSEMSFTNYLLPIHIINESSKFKKKPRILYTSSSLIFGSTENSPQNELTKRKPICDYSKQKHFTEQILINLGKSLGINVFIAILYNHESIYRKSKFFSKKVIKFCSNCFNNNLSIDYIGINGKLELFNPDSIIDMGYAPEFVEYLIKLILTNKPGSYIISTAIGITVKDFVNEVLELYKLDKNFIEFNKTTPRYNAKLIGNHNKIKKLLGSAPILHSKNLVKKLCQDYENCIK